MSDPIRLNKALALAGVASRRGADELIEQGLVTVNGRAVDGPGLKIDPNKDAVAVRGKVVRFPQSEHVYVLLNKPVQTVTTVKDPQGRTTVLDILPPELKKRRLFPVGRLDFFSEGLLILTSDGDLAHALMHPSMHQDKVYEVVVRGKVPEAALSTMRDGMTLAEGEKLAPVAVTSKPLSGGRTLLSMTLSQGINRQIRRMCRDLGLTVLSLKRVQQGPLSLGNLPPGKARNLSPAEVAALQKVMTK